MIGAQDFWFDDDLYDSAAEARVIADIHADLATEHSIEGLSRCMPSDRDRQLARQQPWVVSGWDCGAA